MAKRERYHLIDFIRGLTLISMIIYHACWDLVYLFGTNLQGYTGLGGFIWQQSICWSFILLSGFCANLGKSQYKRGLEVSLAGILITVITVIFMPNAVIWWGVLTLIGSGMLFTRAFQNILNKISGVAGIIISFILFILCRWTDLGFIGIRGFMVIFLPEVLYRNKLTAYFGFSPENFFSTDYFPLIPWLFLYLTGYFLYRVLQPKIEQNRAGLPKIFSFSVFKPIEFLGRHSLLIYMLHQPVIYIVLTALAPKK